MPTRRTLALVLSLAMITSACSSPMKTPNIKQNPQPHQRYELTVTLSDTPGPFDKVAAEAGYQVANVDCVPYHSFVGVHSPIPNAGQEVTLERTDDKTWKGYFYLDRLQDEDYFSLGVCHWKMQSVGADFTVHGQSFGTALDLHEAMAGKPLSKCFKKQDYFNRDINNANAGSALEWRAGDEDVVKHPNEYFSITLTAKKVEP